MQMVSFVHRFTMEALDNDVYMWEYDPIYNVYREYQNGWEVEPGKSYWFFAWNRRDLMFDGYPVGKDYNIEVKLKNGWNMIASPNDTDYRWDNVQVLQYGDDGTVIISPVSSSSDDVLDRKLWRWVDDEGDYAFYAPASYAVPDELKEELEGYRDDSVPLLKPGEGYWVQVNLENVSLIFPAEGRLDLSDSGTLTTSTTRYGRTGQSAAYSGPPAPPQVDGSTGSSGGGASCFIATAYDSPMQFNSVTVFVISVFLSLAGVAVSFGKRRRR